MAELTWESYLQRAVDEALKTLPRPAHVLVCATARVSTATPAGGTGWAGVQASPQSCGDSPAGSHVLRRWRFYATVQGLTRGTPVGSKSATSRVTTVIPWTRAVAAMSASRKGRGSGT